MADSTRGGICPVVDTRIMSGWLGISGIAERQMQVFKVVVRNVSQRRRHTPGQLVEMNSTSRLERSPNSDGITPLSRFLERSSQSSFVSLPSSAGIAPLRWLWDSSLRLGRLPSSRGISLLSRFPPRNSDSRVDSSASSSGIFPSKWPPRITRLFRLESLLNWAVSHR